MPAWHPWWHSSARHTERDGHGPLTHREGGIPIARKAVPMAETTAQALTPREVPAVETKYRRIHTAIPVPESIPILEQLRKYEPRSMSGQPLVVWDRAEACQVFDRWGNRWLDWSSGVLVTNAGHNHPRLPARCSNRSIAGWSTTCFPSNERLAAKLRKSLRGARQGVPADHREATGVRSSWPGPKRGSAAEKIGIVTFDCLPRPPRWGPDGRRHPRPERVDREPSTRRWSRCPSRTVFAAPTRASTLFSRSSCGPYARSDRRRDERDLPRRECEFRPAEYIQRLRAWCDEHQVTLILDEVQAGFGRTGTYWGFEHYGGGARPDLLRQRISSGMPSRR